MNEYLSAEEFYSNYLKTLNPFIYSLSRFEFFRVKILIKKELSKDEEKSNLYLLDIYVDIKIGKKSLSPFYSRILNQYSDKGSGLASFLIYYCNKNNIYPFSKPGYLNYVFTAVKNKYMYSLVYLIYEYIIENITLSKEQALKYVNQIEDDKIKSFFLIYLNLSETNIESNIKVVNQLEEYSKEDYLIIFVILGKIFDDGKYVIKDIQKAIAYYKTAADNKDIYSINRLAEIYTSGLVPFNISKSLYYYKQSLNLVPNNILKIIKLKIETRETSNSEIDLMIQSLNKIDSDESAILLGKIYLEYPYLKKEKEGLFLLNYYALTNPNIYYYLYLFFNKKNNRKEAIRYLRKGVVKKDLDCINEAKGYKKLYSLIHLK